MMATLVGELPKHGTAGAWSVSAPRDGKRLCQNVSVKMFPEKMGFGGSSVFAKGLGFGVNASSRAPLRRSASRNGVVRARFSAAIEKPMYLGEFKGFVEELRFQAMRLRMKEQANGASVEEYLKFLVDSKKVYETMEEIVMNFSHPSCESNSVTFQLGCVLLVTIYTTPL